MTFSVTRTVQTDHTARITPVSERMDRKQELRLSVTIIPVLSDMSPDRSGRVDGYTRSFSHKGVILDLATRQKLTSSVIIALEYQPGHYRHAPLEVQCSTPVTHQHICIETHYGGFASELFQPTFLRPTLDLQSMRFHFGKHETLLTQWEQVGVLWKKPLDCIQVCNKCGSLPTFRKGCPQCGSGYLLNDRLIHHYSCAHVGPAVDFDTPESISCPKCLVRNLVVGADFEHLTGICRCNRCSWSGQDTVSIAHCLHCGHRDCADQMSHQEIFEYHVEQLDPLDFGPDA